MKDIDYRIKCWYRGACNLEAEKCEKICIRYKEMNYLINNCGMSQAEKYLKTIYPQNNELQSYLRLQQIKDNVVSFVESGRNLFIQSKNLQTGKTTWSLKILYKFFDEIWSGNGFRVRGYFLYVPEFLMNLKDFEYRETAEFKDIDKILKTVDLVVWDDILAQELTPMEQNLISFYIDKRIQMDKANIFNGTIVNQEDLEKLLGAKIAQRLNTNCELVTLVGTSRTK